MKTDLFFKKFDLIADAPNAMAKTRELILELAMCGRLATQNINDEPAATQLQRINAEKVNRKLSIRSRKTTTNTAMLNAAEIDLPCGWSLTRMADLVTIWNGRAYSKNELLDQGTPVLRVGNLFSNKHWYYSTLELEPEKYCDKGDLIFAWSASFGPFIWPGPKVIYHYHIWKLESHSKADLDQQFLYWFLQNRTQEIKRAGHGVSMLHMTKEKMEKLVVPLPPLAEQKRIVAKVDELMALCDRLEAQQREREKQASQLARASLARFAEAPTPPNLQYLFHKSYDISPADLRKSILTLAVQGKLVPQDPNDEPASQTICRARIRAASDRRLAKNLKTTAEVRKAVTCSWPELPVGWEWTCNAELGDTSPRNMAKDEILVAFAPMNRIPTDFKTPLAFESRPWGEIKKAFTHFANGDIAVAKITPCFQNGKACVMEGLQNGIGAGSTELHVLRPHPETVTPTYMLLVYKSPDFVSDGVATFSGTAGQQRVSNDYFRFRPIPLPPIAEQYRIVAKVDELMTLVDQLEQQLAHSRTLGQQLLEAVVAKQTV